MPRCPAVDLFLMLLLFLLLVIVLCRDVVKIPVPPSGPLAAVVLATKRELVMLLKEIFGAL